MTHMEKRKNTRVVFRTKATVRFADDVFAELTIKDLSLRGVYLAEVSGRHRGERCEMLLVLTGTSDEIKLNMTGEVVRQDEDGVGVHFIETDVDTFFHLKNIVYYNANDPDQVEDENGLVENIPEGLFVE